MLDSSLARLRHIYCTATLPSVARRVRQSNLTYLTEEKLHNLLRTLRGIDAAGVPGDCVEVGVALGGSGILIASQLGPDRAFYGFDVFGMIPPPGEHDDAKSHERYAAIRSGKSQGIGGDPYYGYMDDLYERVKASFARFGHPVDDRTVVLRRGLVAETLVFPAGARIAFAHIDCDWYDPVRLSLERLSPLLSPGGAIILDDFGDYGGCREAALEMLAATPDLRLERERPAAVLRKA